MLFYQFRKRADFIAYYGFPPEPEGEAIRQITKYTPKDVFEMWKEGIAAQNAKYLADPEKYKGMKQIELVPIEKPVPLFLRQEHAFQNHGEGLESHRSLNTSNGFTDPLASPTKVPNFELPPSELAKKTLTLKSTSAIRVRRFREKAQKESKGLNIREDDNKSRREKRNSMTEDQRIKYNKEEALRKKTARANAQKLILASVLTKETKETQADS